MSTEVPSTQESLNKLDQDIWNYLKEQIKKVSDGTLHRDTRIILSFFAIGLFFFIYSRRALVSNPFDRMHVLSGVIFIFIIIYSFEKLMNQVKYNIDTFCEETDTNQFEMDLSNKFYAGFTFIFYYLNLFAKVITNTILLFAVFYIIYMLAMLQSEGAMFKRSMWQLDFKRSRKASIIKCILLVPIFIRLSEYISQKMLGGNKAYKHPDGTYRYNYEHGSVIRIREFKEFLSPEHLMHFANILIPKNLQIHKFVFLTGLLFSGLYGMIFIHPVDKDNVCNNKGNPVTRQVFTTMSSQLRLGLLILVTVVIMFYLVFVIRMLVDTL